MHPALALRQYTATGINPIARTAAPVARTNRTGLLNDEPVKDEKTGELTCACTGSKIMYGVGGVALGALAMYFVNDEMKAKGRAKARDAAGRAGNRAKAAGARALDRGAARLRG